MYVPQYIVTVVYLHIGVCYGFQVLRVAESPNAPFTILFSRFNQSKSYNFSLLYTKVTNQNKCYIFSLFIYVSGPEVIIYDNGCNLHNYCLNREPVFFKLSWFLVDRFHWPNHTGIYKICIL